MWRSLVRASLSRHRHRQVSRSLLPTQSSEVLFSSQTLIHIQSQTPPPHFSTPKTTSFSQNPRFFSQHSHNPSDFEENGDDFSAVEAEQSSGAFTENGDAQMDSFSASGDEIHDYYSVGFAENGDTQMGDMAPEGEGEEEVVHDNETDVEKLENVLSLLQSSVDGSTGSSLDDMGLVLNEEFMVKVLETPLILGENLIEFYRWASNKPGFKVTAPIVNALVRAICGSPRVRDAYALWDLIKEIGEQENNVLNVEVLNELIALFSHLGKGKVAFEAFNKIGEFGGVPNASSYYFTIEALCKRSIFDWASSVCEKMLNDGSLPDSEKVGKIIAWLCKGRKVKDAHSVYILAKEQNKYPPQSSVNFLIGSLCREDENVRLALEILEDFSGETRKYAIKPFSAVISGLCRIKDMDGAKKLLVKMIAEGPPPGNAVFNSVVTGYSKAGDMGEAVQIMRMMESRGLKPDVYTYTVIMSGYANGGQMEEACKILSEAKEKHSKLSPATYHTLIRGYCKMEEFDNALKILGEMKSSGVQPNVDEYNKLIQSLCLEALDWGTAERLLEEMEENGLYLNGITRGLISAVKDLEEEAAEARGLVAES